MWSLKEQVFINVYHDCWIGGSPAVEEKWRGETFWKNRMDVSCKTFVYFLTFHNSEFQVWQYENMHRSSHLINASMHLNKQILHDAPSPIWSDRISINEGTSCGISALSPNDKLTPTKRSRPKPLTWGLTNRPKAPLAMPLEGLLASWPPEHGSTNWVATESYEGTAGAA